MIILEYLGYIFIGFVAGVYVMGTLFAFTIAALSRNSDLDVWVFVFVWPVFIVRDEIEFRKKIRELYKPRS